MKKCRVCLETKSIDEFYANTGSRDGHLNKCKVCSRKQAAAYYRKNIEKAREQGRLKSQRYRENHPYNER